MGLLSPLLRRAARAASTRRIYRGIDRPHDPERAAMLGDRWWHTNPAVASTYAPGSNGAHVVPGDIVESALRMARIEAPAGTMWRSIPVDSFPPDIRRAFPRSTTHVSSQELASAAEAAGYDGMMVGGMRDSGFAGAIKGAYPGFGTGDEGHVVTMFRRGTVRSPFGGQLLYSGLGASGLAGLLGAGNARA